MYNKLFSKILDSTIWLEPVTTRIVWITLLASMDDEGYAHFSSIRNLAIRAGVTIDEAQKAVDCFLSPDPESADPSNEGKRIERVPGGFIILNAKKYREMYRREHEKELNRKRVADHRSRTKTITPALQGVTDHVSHDYDYALPRDHALTVGNEQQQTPSAPAPTGAKPKTPPKPQQAKNDVQQQSPLEAPKRGAEVPKAPPTPTPPSKLNGGTGNRVPAPAGAASTPNPWGLWIDCNRAHGRRDPINDGPDLSAAKRLFKALDCDAARFTRLCTAYLADKDRFLIAKGHALKHLSPNKYENAGAFSGAKTLALLPHGKPLLSRGDEGEPLPEDLYEDGPDEDVDEPHRF